MCLSETQSDGFFEPNNSFPSHMFELVHSFCYLVIELLPEAFSENAFPGVELYGSEFDETRRKHYTTTVSDLYKRTWIPANSEKVRITHFLTQLLQLLTNIFSQECALSPSAPSSECLQEFCASKFGKEGEGEAVDYLRLAHPQFQSLSLVYADSELIFQFLQLLNLLTVHRQTCISIEILLCEAFVLFLYNNCQDNSCFFRPIQRVLDNATAGSRFSKLFISLITRAPSHQFEGRYKPHDTAEFIQCGGGMMVLRSLVTSSKQALSISGSREFSIYAINKLGQKDTPHKPINDSTQLVDFFPISSSYLQSSKGYVKVSQNIRAFSVFQHTFAPNEKCIQLHVVFKHPILLHNFICCMVATDGATSSTSHGSPSKVSIECSVHGGIYSAVPVTPAFATDSLKVINVAFHAPVLTQHMTVRFHLPLLSRTVVVAKVEVLGTSYGTIAQAIAPKSSLAEIQTQRQQELQHQG